MPTGPKNQKGAADGIGNFKATGIATGEETKGLEGNETEFEKLKRAESEARARIGSFRASDRLSRDELHER